MIEDLEADLAGALKETPNTDNLAVAEKANVDEAVTTEAKTKTRLKLILNIRKIHNHIKRQGTLTLKILKKLKIKQSIYNPMEDNLRSHRTRVFKEIWHFYWWFH